MGFVLRFLVRLIAIILATVPTALSVMYNPLPNVLIITIDTLRADHLRCFRYKHIHTPNIDALTADRIAFERPCTPVPITRPSHTIIFTGTYPSSLGRRDFRCNRLSAQQPKLASILKQHGYTHGRCRRIGRD